MSPLGALAAFVVAASGHAASTAVLPVCPNRVINQVVKRAGCTLGDTRCWFRAGGFCMDYVEQRAGRGRTLALDRMVEVRRGEVQPGDVAVFLSRAHYAYVERVAKDAQGTAVSVDLSEYNYGTCWVDRNALVTDQYGAVNRRRGVAVGAVDGGFLRVVR